MSEVKCPMFLVVLAFFWTVNGGEDKVCVVSGSCILPCSFQPGSDVVIHWINLAGDTPVHAFYHNKDQLEHQNKRFRDRTSLFKDEISKGNASLLLTKVDVQDQGRYKCYTSTISGNKDSFISLNVEGPVTKISILQVENRVTCSSERIYPEPNLTWSTSPPSTLTTQDKPTVQKSVEQLYSISSSLILSNSNKDLVYSCTVSTSRHKRTVTLLKPTSITGSDILTIPCTALKTPLTAIIWSFNHSEIILTRTDISNFNVSEEWTEHVKDVSEAGSLTLQHLSSGHEGTYTCELSIGEETYVVDTFLRIKSQDNLKVAGIAVGVIVGVCLCLVGYYIWKHRRPRSTY